MAGDDSGIGSIRLDKTVPIARIVGLRA